MKTKNYFIKTFIILMLSVLVLASASTNVDAKKMKVQELRPVFEETITLENEKTKLDIGFVTVTFKKGFIEKDAYPITFDVKLYADDGEIYIEFSPDYEDFIKDVKIQVHAYEGWIYDVAADDYIYIEIPKLKMKVSHFSRWCFVW